MANMLIIRAFVLLLCVCLSWQVDPWDLPAIPAHPPHPRLGNASMDKNIPRHLWIAVRDSKDPLNFQMPPLFQRNEKWEVHICDNQEKDEFMNKTFANTSLLWAYHMIHSVAAAAKADLWRYAVLWTYGGAYIDDDSDMMVPLDKCIEPQDELIVAYEKNGFNGNRCFIPRFHLSDFATFKNASREGKLVFHGRVLLNWAIMSAPRHPVMAQVMRNAVEIIKHEYFQESVIRSMTTMYRWEAIMCATGPSLLTGTAREMVLEEKEEFTYKLANLDFKDFGGKFKAFHMPVKNDPNHYMRNMARSGPGLLKEYLPEQMPNAEQLKALQGRPIQAQNGKEIFVLDEGKRRGIPNYDTFLALNFSMADVHVMSDSKIRSIPLGSSMPNMST